LKVGAAFIACVFALGAAFIAVRAARQQERREVEALRLSLAVEIRRLVDVSLDEAKAAVADGSRPGLIQSRRNLAPIREPMKQKYLDDLRKAGMPERADRASP
jgi:hypothetical protein